MNDFAYIWNISSKMSRSKVPYSLVDITRRDLLPAVPGNRPRQSCYKFNYVHESHRAPATPRTNRHLRMRHLHGLWAFYRNRFYEKDRWYKARIEKPVVYPKCYYIDPLKFSKSLVERLAELNVKDPVLDEPVDIGLPSDSSPPEDLQTRLAELRKKNGAELERAARLKTLRVDVDAVERESWSSTGVGSYMIRRLAEHYGIFRDLFHPAAYFNPVVQLKIQYEDSKESNALNPVLNGNILTPEEASKQPKVDYDAEPGSLWTLLLTNPDGNLYEDGKEVAHWLVCNIPENRVKDGETIIDYAQPLPLKGTGYHRMVCVLFRQDNGRIDLSSFKKSQPLKKLEDRTFHTPSFYKKCEDQITPAGLSFFQTSWDGSCSRYFHQNLDMAEPHYDYEWPKRYVPPQEEFPTENVAFHKYLDQYRDQKDIEKELLTKRLKHISPFKNDVADKQKRRQRQYFANVFFEDDQRNLPSWKHLEQMRENQGLGKYRAIFENRID